MSNIEENAVKNLQQKAAALVTALTEAIECYQCKLDTLAKVDPSSQEFSEKEDIYLALEEALDAAKICSDNLNTLGKSVKNPLKR